MSVPVESPLPRYGLAGPFVGVRWCRVDEEGDVSEAGHCPAGAEGEVSVMGVRRTTAMPTGGASGVAISDELARERVATALVLGNSSAGDEVSAVAREVARDDEAWREREITVDGEVVMAREREFASRWVAYYLTPLLIVYVLAPVEVRPEVLKLRRFEVPRRESAATRPEELQPDSARFPGEEPLQLYKLVGSFVGERLRGVEGWGMGGMVHRPAGV